jgi:hypothetical protein
VKSGEHGGWLVVGIFFFAKEWLHPEESVTGYIVVVPLPHPIHTVGTVQSLFEEHVIFSSFPGQHNHHTSTSLNHCG